MSQIYSQNMNYQNRSIQSYVQRDIPQFTIGKPEIGIGQNQIYRVNQEIPVKENNIVISHKVINQYDQSIENNKNSQVIVQEREKLYNLVKKLRKNIKELNEEKLIKKGIIISKEDESSQPSNIVKAPLMIMNDNLMIKIETKIEKIIKWNEKIVDYIVELSENPKEKKNDFKEKDEQNIAQEIEENRNEVSHLRNMCSLKTDEITLLSKEKDEELNMHKDALKDLIIEKEEIAEKEKE